MQTWGLHMQVSANPMSSITTSSPTLSPDIEGDTWFEIVNRVKQPLINDESEKDELQRC